MAHAASETLHYDQHTEGGWSWERHAASQVIRPIGALDFPFNQSEDLF